jgi:hypothetical protein
MMAGVFSCAPRLSLTAPRLAKFDVENWQRCGRHASHIAFG